MTEHLIAQRWIESAREQLAKVVGGFLSPMHAKIPELDSLVDEMFTLRGAEADNSLATETLGLWDEAERLEVDGSFEARWVFLCLMRRFFLRARSWLAMTRLPCGHARRAS
jgi:hypothetical protein